MSDIAGGGGTPQVGKGPLPEHEAKRYERHAGLAFAEAERWWIAGIGPIDAWRAADLGLRSPGEWRARLDGEREREDAHRARAVRETGLAESEVETWESAGFDLFGIGCFSRAGVTLAGAQAWAESGFNPQDAVMWLDAGVGPEAASMWARQSFHARDAASWIAFDLDPDRAASWRAQGLDLEDAFEWLESVSDPGEVIRWKQAGMTPAIADSVRHAGLGLEWLEKGFTPAEARIWFDAGLSAAESESWRDAGFDTESSEAWRTADFGSYQSAHFLRLRLDLETAMHWREAGLHAGWAQRFSLKEATKWNALGCSPAEAELWSSAGFSAEQANGSPAMAGVGWDGRTDTSSSIEYLRVDDLRERLRAASESETEVASVTLLGEEIEPLLVVLAEYLEAKDWSASDMNINGEEAIDAQSPSGVRALVPNEYASGVVCHSYSDASWLPGGPVVFDQSVGIYSLGNLYWVYARGDSANYCISVGSHPAPPDAIAACVEVSPFHSFSESGELLCEVDDWPNEE
jgi:hypothetical protein